VGNFPLRDATKRCDHDGRQFVASMTFQRDQPVTAAVTLPQIFMFTCDKGSHSMNESLQTVKTVTPAKAEVHNGGTMFRIPRAPLGRKAGEKKAQAD
jgi:hypothetical protein